MAASGDHGGQPVGEQAYFRLPRQSWSVIWPSVGARLQATAERLNAALDEQRRAGDAASPAELALELGATATALFEQLAPEERDLRELVSTLRTALALCWDMYSYSETSKVSVQAHMDRLRTEIEGFEAQLEQLQAEQVTGEEEG